MTCARHSTFQSKLAFTVMAFSLWFLSGGLVSATTAPSLQGIIVQVADYAASGQIYDAAASDDLTSMLDTINSVMADGDNITAQSLLGGFINTVHQMSDVLMTPMAADQLISLANALAMSL